MNGKADTPSRRIDDIKGQHEEKRPLLCSATLQADDPVWIDNRILEYLKVAFKEDTTLKTYIGFPWKLKAGPIRHSPPFSRIFFS